MDGRQLRAFVAVADSGGISAAAQKLGYAQSSISAQLQRLEAELGVSLLVRTTSGAVLSDAGARMLPHAREALELEERIRRAALGGRGRLRIGAQESLAHGWIPEVLAAFGYGAAGPDVSVDVDLTVANRERLAAAFAAGELDLVFQYDNGRRSLGPHAVVGHDRTVLVAAPWHPLAGREYIAAEELTDYDFLVAEPECTSQMLVDRLGRDLLADAQLSSIQGSVSALLRLAGHGRGLSLLPAMAVDRELENGELVELSLRQPLRPVSIVAQWRARLGEAEGALHALLRLARRANPLPELPDERKAAPQIGRICTQ